MTLVRGSPDHTVLSEQSFAHYKDVRIYRGSADIDAWPDMTVALDADIRGVWGWFTILANKPSATIKVTIDDTIVFHQDITRFKTRGIFGMNSSWLRQGCTLWNEVIAEEWYNVWIDSQMSLYIHENIKIEVYWYPALAAGDRANWEMLYKELI